MCSSRAVHRASADASCRLMCSRWPHRAAPTSTARTSSFSGRCARPQSPVHGGRRRRVTPQRQSVSVTCRPHSGVPSGAQMCSRGQLLSAQPFAMRWSQHTTPRSCKWRGVRGVRASAASCWACRIARAPERHGRSERPVGQLWGVKTAKVARPYATHQTGSGDLGLRAGVLFERAPPAAWRHGPRRGGAGGTTPPPTHDHDGFIIRLHARRTPAFFTSNMPLTESPVWMHVITWLGLGSGQGQG